jgi:transposase
MTMRPGGEFFAVPSGATQRRYEALRAYLYEGLPAREAADRVGWAPETLTAAVRDFRAGRRDYFVTPKPGPRSAPAKDGARARIVALRRQGHSAYEISEALAQTDTPLNRTGVAEVLAEEGFTRQWPRPHAVRGGPRRETLERAEVVEFSTLPDRVATKVAGVYLAIPELVALDLPRLVAEAGYPGTRVIPAVSTILSLLCLKLVAMRRVSHVYDLAADPAAGLFAGLGALPKATALTDYSYRTSHGMQASLLKALGASMVAQGLADGADFDLDFHAIMHYGDDPVLEEHYVPRRSQRTASVLTFFAQDAPSGTIVYANADVRKASQSREVIAFCDHWRKTSGHDPSLVVFDSKLTTQEVLGELDARGVRFITLRMRSPALMASLDALPPKAWRTVSLDRPGSRHTRPQVVEDPGARLSSYPGTIRQLAVRGLGHDKPTIIVTNDRGMSAKAVIERYAHRMGMEQRLAEAIRSFHLDALSSAVALNVDLDVALSVVAGAACASFRRRLAGYATATPDTLQHRFLNTPGEVINRGGEIVVRLDRKTYNPVLRQADLPVTEVPWWGGRTLRFEYR